MAICLYVKMPDAERPPDDLDAAADLFRALSSISRLRLLRLLAQERATVGSLAERSGLSQPLVSQHLRTLRNAGLVSVERSGREARYAIADEHVAHIVEDAVLHAGER
jgi:ArsR family transcriptional regulator, zinc-responsive transcriptional repressor